jgi:hypothetical protein
MKTRLVSIGLLVAGGLLLTGCYYAGIADEPNPYRPVTILKNNLSEGQWARVDEVVAILRQKHPELVVSAGVACATCNPNIISFGQEKGARGTKLVPITHERCAHVLVDANAGFIDPVIIAETISRYLYGGDPE